ncbi:quaternary ammonium compound efflux SMR transporter SugE [Geoalkalibacter sp.]|uniref:quaternary ammonium compound efflux SMR transporter SugE n=1 Tax=Geoalkalibacter sp. TaxID=3041440 RepID=UPI00272DE713|nr:quaternary ammonium compound efflux SMR transporter SugE [Geoalkalibacter sp.]
MAWMQLFIAGLFEVIWAVGLKFTHGFTRIGPSVLTIAAMGVSFWFLTQALRTLPVGTAYAVWTGIGAVGTAAVGMLFLGEPRTALRLFFIVLIVIGIAGLKWSASR